MDNDPRLNIGVSGGYSRARLKEVAGDDKTTEAVEGDNTTHGAQLGGQFEIQWTTPNLGPVQMQGGIGLSAYYAWGKDKKVDSFTPAGTQVEGDNCEVIDWDGTNLCDQESDGGGRLSDASNNTYFTGTAYNHTSIYADATARPRFNLNKAGTKTLEPYAGVGFGVTIFTTDAYAPVKPPEGDESDRLSGVQKINPPAPSAHGFVGVDLGFGGVPALGLENFYLFFQGEASVSTATIGISGMDFTKTKINPKSDLITGSVTMGLRVKLGKAPQKAPAVEDEIEDSTAAPVVDAEEAAPEAAAEPAVESAEDVTAAAADETTAVDSETEVAAASEEAAPAVTTSHFTNDPAIEQAVIARSRMFGIMPEVLLEKCGIKRIDSASDSSFVVTDTNNNVYEIVDEVDLTTLINSLVCEDCAETAPEAEEPEGPVEYIDFSL